jgi:ornithine--oxo-acid transaminase
MKKSAQSFISQNDAFGVHNYSPLPVVLTRGKGAFVFDVEGRKYFDMLSAYSALNQGHNHPKIAAAAKRQMERLCLTSRAFYSDRLGEFIEKLCKLSKLDRALPMNSGAEAVESAIKAMRLWGYRVKGVRPNKAEIIVCDNNFHGRTTSIVGFSSEPISRDGFGPFAPGFKHVPFGDAKALERAITPQTCGFLFEPIQGEAGVLIPPPGYYKAVRRLCTHNNVLMCADEIQTGLGRTGALFCLDHEKVLPDLLVMGKALSGGFYPISAVAGKDEVLSLFTPGSHGSTYGGSPLAAAIGCAALDVIVREHLALKSKKLGALFMQHLSDLRHPVIKEVRGRGLLVAVEFKKPAAKEFCKALMKHGLLAKDTHQTIVRFAPPLVISRTQIGQAARIIRRALETF